MKRIFYKAEISFSDKNYEKIYNTIYLAGISTILEDKGTLQIFVNEDEKEKLVSLKDGLLTAKIISEQDFSIEKFTDRDWNDEWKKSIEPIYIKNRIIVTPTWKLNSLKNTEGKIIIQIDPKMSFGTGHNETTQLMLDLMIDHIDKNDKYMLDFGTGSAVLAIAGIKLGIEKAAAIDTDIDSIFNAEENAENNDVSINIILHKANIADIKEKDFDLITANIDRTVITLNIESIKEKLKKKGKLLITGILHNENDEIINLLKKNGFILKETRSKAEWLAYYAVKK